MVTVQQVDSTTFSPQGYNPQDVNVLPSASLNTEFKLDTDYIEFYVLDSTQNIIDSSIPHRGFSVVTGSVIFDPSTNLKDEGYNEGQYFTLYNFYRKILHSSPTEKYYISEISGDRTEIRLASTTIENEEIISSTNDFIEYRESNEYFVDFYLNFGDNKTIIANNIALDIDQNDNPTILIKLYNPLPSEFDKNTQTWVIEELSLSQAYKVDFPFEVIEETDYEFIAGPNFNLNITTQVGESSESYSLSTLAGSNISSSTQQLNSLLANQGIEININYENFNEFINFSSAKTRLENFIYKVELIENNQAQIDSLTNSLTTSSALYSSSRAEYDRVISDTTKNFDSYEYFLYYESGSDWTYPKSSTTQPYTLYPSTSSIVSNWETNILTSASNYDENNQNWLYNVIPEYLRDDPQNQNYEIFVDMLGQHYDSIWVYTKDITNKFSADNRLDYGISKDLVADAIKDFGVKLYSNNFNTQDLYRAFLGIDENNNLLNAVTGSEHIDTYVSASTSIIPLDKANKRLYKRIYHNIPYLIKSKGTTSGLKALITSFGIPDTILDVKEYGDVDNDNWNHSQEVFNYKYISTSDSSLSTSFKLNPTWGSTNNRPETILFRFQTTGTNNFLPSQSIWSLDNAGVSLVLDHTGSLNTSGSYSGSILSSYNDYGTLKLIPDTGSISDYASINLPFYNGDWWSVMINKSGSTYELHSANKIEYGNGEVNIGFEASSSITSSATFFESASNAYYPSVNSNINLSGSLYPRLSGSYQEIRYYNTKLSKSKFYNYVVNPSSFEGNSLNSSPSELAFRLPLGNELKRDIESIHPKTFNSISSSFATSSFNNDVFIVTGDNAEFSGGAEYLLLEDDGRIIIESGDGFLALESTGSLSNENFDTNVETIFINQPGTGIKNNLDNKIKVIEDSVLDNTLSAYRSTISPPKPKAENIQYTEVAFSPQNQINKDISGQLGNFNIGDYIGDPRQSNDNNTHYPDLDKLRDSYFEKYSNSYNVKDFIRLIKFLDNSLFKMIKDFTPASTSLTSGVVIKQHLLERNKLRVVQADLENQQYSGSVKSAPNNFEETSLYKNTGGSGGSFDEINTIETSPEQVEGNRFNITQSWSEILTTKDGLQLKKRTQQYEFFNGEFGGPTDENKLQKLIDLGVDLRGGRGLNNGIFIFSTTKGEGGSPEECKAPEYKDYFVYPQFFTTPPDCTFDPEITATPISVPVPVQVVNPIYPPTPPPPAPNPPSGGGGGTISPPTVDPAPECGTGLLVPQFVDLYADKTSALTTENIKLTAEFNGADIIRWSNGQTGRSITVNASNEGTVTYSVFAISSDGCESETGNITLTFSHPEPVKPDPPTPPPTSDCRDFILMNNTNPLQDDSYTVVLCDGTKQSRQLVYGSPAQYHCAKSVTIPPSSGVTIVNIGVIGSCGG